MSRILSNHEDSGGTDHTAGYYTAVVISSVLVLIALTCGPLFFRCHRRRRTTVLPRPPPPPTIYVDFQTLLVLTTMTVESKDLIPKNTPNEKTAATDPATIDPELGMNPAEDQFILQLPNNSSVDNNLNANRSVPGSCAICLCPYETGQQVSWSALPTCCHAYHTACIIPYAEKCTEQSRSASDNELSELVVPCPLCRNAFVQCPIGEKEEHTATTQ